MSTLEMVAHKLWVAFGTIQYKSGMATKNLGLERVSCWIGVLIAYIYMLNRFMINK